MAKRQLGTFFVIVTGNMNNMYPLRMYVPGYFTCIRDRSHEAVQRSSVTDDAHYH